MSDSLAITLLERFAHVFPEDIPLGLHHKRSIQQHIDLIPGPILPNKPAHRMNLRDIIEIQRKVKEFISKALVRESLSPCAVLVLFVLKKDYSMCMCVDNHAISKITINIRTPSHGIKTCWMSFTTLVCCLKWILEVVTTKSTLERVMNGRQRSRPKEDCMSGL